MLHVGHAIGRDITPRLALKQTLNPTQMKIKINSTNRLNSSKRSMSKKKYLNLIKEYDHIGQIVVFHQIQDHIKLVIGKEITSLNEAGRKNNCIATLAKAGVTLALTVRTSNLNLKHE